MGKNSFCVQLPQYESQPNNFLCELTWLLLANPSNRTLKLLCAAERD